MVDSNSSLSRVPESNWFVNRLVAMSSRRSEASTISQAETGGSWLGVSRGRKIAMILWMLNTNKQRFKPWFQSDAGFCPSTVALLATATADSHQRSNLCTIETHLLHPCGKKSYSQYAHIRLATSAVQDAQESPVTRAEDLRVGSSTSQVVSETCLCCTVRRVKHVFYPF